MQHLYVFRTRNFSKTKTAKCCSASLCILITAVVVVTSLIFTNPLLFIVIPTVAFVSLEKVSIIPEKEASTALTQLQSTLNTFQSTTLAAPLGNTSKGPSCVEVNKVVHCVIKCVYVYVRLYLLICSLHTHAVIDQMSLSFALLLRVENTNGISGKVRFLFRYLI